MALVEAVVPIEIHPSRVETQPRPSTFSRVRSTVQDHISERRITKEARLRSQATRRRHHESIVPQRASFGIKKKAGVLLRASEVMDKINRNKILKKVVVHTLHASGVDVGEISRRALSRNEEDIEIHEDYIAGRPKKEQIDIIVSTSAAFLLLFRREILDRERVRLQPSNPNPQSQPHTLFDAKRIVLPIAAT